MSPEKTLTHLLKVSEKILAIQSNNLS